MEPYEAYMRHIWFMVPIYMAPYVASICEPYMAPIWKSYENQVLGKLRHITFSFKYDEH